ncbi:MAG: capsular biosynthesis protein, partial [Bacteroidales bacterium]|nr:capsular biosynthesis protein [Bacteroidales bacterium]
MGLFSRKKTLVASGVFNSMQDAHSHILPGVDDGVQTMEESLAILSEFE